MDLVITKSISRFARNTVTLLETIRELKSLGIDVFFEEQNIHAISSDGEAHVVPRRIKSGQQPELLAVKNYILFHCPLDGVRLRVVPERAFWILQG